MTPFGFILKRAVEATPGAIGGAFADSEGEMVDSFAAYDAHEWAVLTAHYGVLFAQLHSAFGVWHFGGPEFFIARHALLDILVHQVEGGYFALLALADVDDSAAPITAALGILRRACGDLRREMQ